MLVFIQYVSPWLVDCCWLNWIVKQKLTRNNHNIKEPSKSRNHGTIGKSYYSIHNTRTRASKSNQKLKKPVFILGHHYLEDLFVPFLLDIVMVIKLKNLMTNGKRCIILAQHNIKQSSKLQQEAYRKREELIHTWSVCTLLSFCVDKQKKLS